MASDFFLGALSPFPPLVLLDQQCRMENLLAWYISEYQMFGEQ